MEIDFRDYKSLDKEKVCAIGIGTWAIKDYKKAFETYKKAVDLGMNVIDTAEMYDKGNAEKFVGKVVKNVGRERVFLITKILPWNLEDRFKAKLHMEKSLKRLKLSYVDLVLVHWSESYDLIPTYIKNLEYLQDLGYSRYIGVSNFDLVEIEKGLESLKKSKIILNQVKYSALDKRVENGLMDFLQKNKIVLQAYTPLENGRIAFEKDLIEIGKKYKKTAIQVGLNYLICHKDVIAIPKSEKIERIKEFKGSLGWRLKENDIIKIKKI